MPCFCGAWPTGSQEADQGEGLFDYKEPDLFGLSSPEPLVSGKKSADDQVDHAEQRQGRRRRRTASHQHIGLRAPAPGTPKTEGVHYTEYCRAVLPSPLHDKPRRLPG